MGEDMKTFVYSVDDKELGEEPFTEMPIDFGRIKPAPVDSEIILCAEPRGKYIRDVTGPQEDRKSLDEFIERIDRLILLLHKKAMNGTVNGSAVVFLLLRLRGMLKELKL